MLAVVRGVTLAAYLHPILAVRLPDARLGATLRSLCLILSLNLRGQQQRLRRDPALRKALVTAAVPTRQGPRDTDVLLAWAIPIWLVGLQSSRLTPEKQDLIRLLQEQAVQAIYQAFSAAIQQDTLPEATPDDMQVDSLPTTQFDALNARVDRIERQIDQIEARVFSVEAHLSQIVVQLGRESQLRLNDERLLSAAITRLMLALPAPMKRHVRQRRKRRSPSEKERKSGI
jgi:hypothetical protein